MSNVETAAQLRSATAAFDSLFANQIGPAKEAFADGDSPFHLLGQGVCAFLEAALGARKKSKMAREARGSHRFQPGLEWDILQADAVVLLGLTNALSESYMGYVQCIYALNSAHSKFTKLYKTVFPTGLDEYPTPAQTPAPSAHPSLLSATSSSASSIRSVNTLTAPRPTLSTSPVSSLFGRWGSSRVPTPEPTPIDQAVDGPISDLVIAGTAFGFGLFNLVFSLLPAKVKGVVGFFGFQHDRRLALQALAVSATKRDVHGVFAGLVLMTYHGVVLLLTGWQADEQHILKQYRAIVDSVEERYPTGALWILNRAKILRMSYDPEAAIRVLQDGLKPDRTYVFREADTLLVFELAWTLLAQRRYQESAEMFVKITELNSWSHATYYFLAAGCYFSLGDKSKAQELFDAIPALLERRKINGKDLPTEVFIKKKLAFYKQKQKARGGVEEKFVDVIRISPAEELGIFWSTHSRIQKATAITHIDEWSSLTPAVTISSPYIPTSSSSPNLVDLDTPDELAIRSLLLGIVHRTVGEYTAARAFLSDAHARQPQVTVSTWVGGVALFEMAVLDLKEADAESTSSSEGKEKDRAMWDKALKHASEELDRALALATGNNSDLSSRLDSRIVMLRDEIALKREMVGIKA